MWKAIWGFNATMLTSSVEPAIQREAKEHLDEENLGSIFSDDKRKDASGRTKT